MSEEKQNSLEEKLLGYNMYKKRVFGEASGYKATDFLSMDQHRREVLEKYKATNTEPFLEVLGMKLGKNFFVPIDFDGVILDAKDVFAISYLFDFDFHIWKKRRDKYVLWLLFTNDRYLPVVPLVTIQSTGFFAQNKAKKCPEFLPELATRCENLTYPICDLQTFEKRIANQRTIDGKPEKTFLQEQIYDAKKGIGLFDPMTITMEMGKYSKELLGMYGYLI